MLSVLKKKMQYMKSVAYDRMLGIETMDDIKAPTSRFIGAGDSSANHDMFIYGPVFYGMLRRVMRRLNPTPDDVFIDLGSGKGRAVFYMSQFNFKRVIGVELDQKVMAIAHRNRLHFRRARSPIEFVAEDASKYEFSDETVIFINNAFGEATLRTVLANIRASLPANPREIRIFYLNPQHKDVLDGQDWLVPEPHDGLDTCHIWRNKD